METTTNWAPDHHSAEAIAADYELSERLANEWLALEAAELATVQS
jgi:hypothetical protein